ncbi:MAG: hypothetical protein ACRENA_07765 [Vulcanimicrobiaceae bacterium]
MLKIAFTVNGPGEYAGWLRPLLHALYARDRELDATVFFVPDDFATGREPAVAASEFPRLRIVSPNDYVRFALGAKLEGLPQSVDRVQYLGGDLMHAMRVHGRLGGIATSYKFSRPRYARRFARVFAVDQANREQLIGWKTPAERIEIVGNLAIDGALRDGQTDDRSASALAADSVVIMPGSRRHEIANLVPFFLRVAMRLREMDSSIPVVFGISPFTTAEELRAALSAGGLPTVYGARGGVVQRDGILYFVTDEGEFPALRQGLAAASRARLAVTIPGTKTIELASLGVPALVTVPFNAPEAVVINGPLQYVERLPFVGVPLKRGLALKFSKRFEFFAQPNLDAGRELFPEIVGTLTPAMVARRVYEGYNDVAWRASVSREASQIYAAHAGASQRMADALVAEAVAA